MREVDFRRLDLNLLVVLHALLQARGVSQAAHRLGMSQPAVSRALARLRGIFDDRLLIKGNPLMTPTSLADGMAGPLAVLLGGIGDFFGGEDGFNQSTSERVLRIATTDYGAIAVLPDLLCKVTAEGPRIGLDVVPFARDTFRMLGDGQIDFALYSNDPIPESLRKADLFTEDYACLVRTGHPAALTAVSGQFALAEYLTYAHALVTVSGDRRGVVDEALHHLGLARRIALWLPYFMTAAFLVAKTDLILTLPRRAVDAGSSIAGLVSLRPPLEIERFGYCMIWHERTHRDPACVWLRGLLQRSLTV